jgi:hypothetical protein
MHFLVFPFSAQRDQPKSEKGSDPRAQAFATFQADQSTRRLAAMRSGYSRAMPRTPAPVPTAGV